MTIALGVLISGRGSNLGALLDAIGDGRLDASVRLVVSNKAGAGGLARAEAAGIATCVLPHGAYPSREAFDAAVVDALRAAGVELVVLAGFMRLVTPVLLDAFPHRVLNIHPALLPAFPGVDAQRQALDYGVRVTGCTVHFVDAGTDTGPILLQETEPVHEDDTPASLSARLLVKEHALLVRAVGLVASGRVRVEVSPQGGRARVSIAGPP